MLFAGRHFGRPAEAAQAQSSLDVRKAETGQRDAGLGAHAAWRARLPGPRAVESARDTHAGPTTVPEGTTEGHMTPAPGPSASSCAGTNRLWALLMARSFGYDVLACPRCGGRFRLIALLEDAAVIQRILRHLGLPTEVPQPRPPRAPPIPFGAGVVHLDDDLATP